MSDLIFQHYPIDVAQLPASWVFSSIAELNASVQSVPFVVPPLNEQRRIVAKIDELFSDLDAAVATLERLKAKLKRYRASVLKAAIEGKLTAEWRAKHLSAEPSATLLERILVERRRRWEKTQRAKFAAAEKTPLANWRDKYQEPTVLDTDGLTTLPEGWCWTTLDSLADISGGVTKGQQRKNDELVRPVPYLRVANVQRGYLDLTEIKTIDVTEQEVNDLRLLKGDILFNEGGDRDKLGRGWVWREEIPVCIHQNHVFRARLVSPDVLPEIVSHHGNEFGRLWFMKAGKQSVNLASINLSVLKRFPVPLAPVEEQRQILQEISARLSVVDQVTAQVDANLKRAGRLRQSILKQAFEGKLVPQVATDEPASVLLERIRQQQNRPLTVTVAAKPGRRRFPSDVLEAVGRLTAYMIEDAAKPLGRKAKAKLLYFAQVRIGIPIRLTFQRWDHGPFDPAIPAAERKAQGKKWFKVKEQQRAGERTDYQKTDLTSRIATEAEILLGDRKAAFDGLLSLFQTFDSTEAELLATVYAAWNDLLLDGRPADEAAITTEVYGWHPSKREKFTPKAITTQIAWMQANGYVPTGTGQRTTLPDPKPKPPSNRKKPSR